MNRAQLCSERVAAGKAYNEAVATLRKAWTRLAAIDRTLQNRHVAGGEAIRSWHFRRLELNDSLRALQHSEYLPRLIGQEWSTEAEKVSDVQIESFKP
jgi:hypothetical protein